MNMKDLESYVVGYEPPPFKPEPIEVLKARFHAAITETYDCTKMEEQIRKVRQVEPGIMARRHLFDFETHVRMIVSREHLQDGNDYIHLSFGIHKDCPWPYSQSMLVGMARNLAEEFTGRTDPTHTKTGPKAVHHWFKI